MNPVILCVVVFGGMLLALMALSRLLDVLAMMLGQSQPEPTQTAEPPKPVHKAAAPAAPAASAAPAAPAAPASSVDAVLVAAAIAAYLGTSTDQFVVRSIRRVSAAQSTPWGLASRANALQ